jgi:ADP-ribose pyrophosphatase
MSETKRVFEGERLLVLERDGWQFAERRKGKSAVAIIATTDDGHVILTEQQRRPVDARVIDWPAGLVGDEDESEDAAETARRELEEETGYVCAHFDFLIESPTSPGITSETVRFYAASGATKKGKGGGVGGEKIEVHLVPAIDVTSWLREKIDGGVLVDMKVWAGLHFLS